MQTDNQTPNTDGGHVCSTSELGPLPEPVVIDRHLPTGIVIRGYTADQMRSYAQQEVAAERERCAGWLEREGRHDMAFGIRRAMHCGPNAKGEQQ